MRRMRNSLRALLHGSVAIAASVSLLLGVQARADVHARDALAQLAAQDIVWKSPGLNGAGSMPLGNGEFAANLWVEANGDIVAVLAHTDAFSEAERLLKLGRVRISCNPALATTPFVQRMSFADGAIYIDAGEGASAAFRPLHGEPHRGGGGRLLDRPARAFVERHGDVGVEQALDPDRTLGGQAMLRAVDRRAIFEGG